MWLQTGTVHSLDNYTGTVQMNLNLRNYQKKEETKKKNSWLVTFVCGLLNGKLFMWIACHICLLFTKW